MNLKRSQFARAATSIIAVTALLCGCGGGSNSLNSGDDTPNKPVSKNRVNWSGVPSQFNPSFEDSTFSTINAEKVTLGLFGSTDDVEVVYTNDVPANSGVLRIFKVWKNQASWGNLHQTQSGTNLELSQSGTYQCSISIKNGEITELDGGCYVRVQVLLPKGSQLEVYNVGQLITKRFIPVDTQAFLEDIHRATWAEDKFVAIENFMASYNNNARRPSMTAQQLGTAIHEFYLNEEQFKALSRLQSTVSDRANLSSMIDNVFGYFDRDQARRICGI